MFDAQSAVMLSTAIADTYNPRLSREMRRGLNQSIMRNVIKNGKKKLSLEEQIKIQEEKVKKLEKCFKDVDEDKLDKLMKEYKQPYAEAKTSKEKKVVLKKFRNEFASILINDHEWQKPIAYLVAKMTKPEYNNKTKTKKAWDKFTELFISAEGGGHLPQFYVGPLAKAMKIERRKITSNNIKYTVGMVGLAAAGAVGVPIIQDATEAVQNAPLIGESYKILGDYFKWMFTIGAGSNFAWTFYRLKKHYKDDEHTPSIGALTAVLPIPIVTQAANIYLFSYAGIKKHEFNSAKRKLESLKNMKEQKSTAYVQQSIPKNTGIENIVNMYKS